MTTAHRSSIGFFKKRFEQPALQIFAENESAIRGVPYLELITSCNLKPPRDTPNEFSQKIANQTPSMIVSIKLPVSA